MPIRWDPEQVRAAIAAFEKLADEADPILLEMQQVAAQAAGQENLPGYMKESLQMLGTQVHEQRQRLKRNIEAARNRIPRAPVARSRPQAGPKLF